MFRTLPALHVILLKMKRRQKMEKTKVMCSFENNEYGLQTGNVKISDLHYHMLRNLHII